MKYTGLRNFAFLIAALAITLSRPASSQAPPSQTTPTQDAIAAIIGKQVKTPSTKTKLEEPLEAVAQGWRRLGIKGAELESAAHGVKLDRLRVPGIIRLTGVEQRATVVAALRRAWGEVVASEEDRIYAWIPVPALRRISLLPAVGVIDLDRPAHPASKQGKE
jgi:hypothetical protein